MEKNTQLILPLFEESTNNPTTEEKQKVVNVSSVPQRSPFRYAGGKTWLIPTIRQWLNTPTEKHLIEPFCGGASVSLTAVAERLVATATMVELDEDVAAVWSSILQDGERLATRILNFNLTKETVQEVLSNEPLTIDDRAFQTIIRNRTNHGGILARGAGPLKNGENGKGISSRWYPNTLAKRIRNIVQDKDRLTFVYGNAFDYMTPEHYTPNTYFFIDPPYTVAGKRLYTHCDVDHEEIFRRVAEMTCHYLMTYDVSDYVIELAERNNLQWRRIPMQTTHLVKKDELLICDNFYWYDRR